MRAGKRIFISCFALLASLPLLCQVLISERMEPGSFSIVAGQVAAAIVVDSNDHILVQKTAALFQQDIGKVTGIRPALVHSIPSIAKHIIIIGSIDRSGPVRALIGSSKMDVANTRNKWEASQIQVVNKPFAGVEHALVIAGSDRRGTAFGVFDLSRQMGVSPWHWWADVPVKKKTGLYVSKDVFKTDAPAVKYRGIFINDEAPALSGWSREKFGGFNHKFYEKVFELMLRLKSNYLWPAMWGNAFYDDDSLNRQLADDYGIVIGTSHHEPLMRAHDEWRRYGKGKWNYDSNEVRLKSFWKEGLLRTGNTEKIVSIGMRGDGDEPMTQGTAIALLERIVHDQRAIIEDVTGKPVPETPQLWALYKEVQDYYDQGMRVPDDVTLLLCDDNWGNIRRLPLLDAKPRKGGYGIYYHFDYVGGPRNYKWLNTNNLARVWEQMHLAWEYNARQIWIVNVGDIKPMELPISFFLDYAWNPNNIQAKDIPAYYTRWAKEQFGEQGAVSIGRMLSQYAQLSSRRKPELLSHDTYNYAEWDRVSKEFAALKDSAERWNSILPEPYRDAYFQLVLHPIQALGNLHNMYYAVARNHYYARHKDTVANKYAAAAKHYFELDSVITLRYHQLGGGKWNHMMSQTHIGYTYWQQPPVNKMPEIKYVHPDSARVQNWVSMPARNAKEWIPKNYRGNVFYQSNSHVSMEAENYSRAVNGKGIQWTVIPGIGKTGSGLCAFPVTAPAQSPGGSSPHLAYDVYVSDKGTATIYAYFSPTLNFHNSDSGLQYAISVDDEAPQIISVNKDDNKLKTWEQWVANNIIIKTSTHNITIPGKHVVKFWLVNPGLVLQKLVLDFSVPGPSYLGPPETKMN
ncbi:MAG TPA: glycosyl hydrolase 115 family protein [Chitinophagaceae bacterium]|nr:glycosyl hydrolase 115 family protein [Chitinophagaceae bacterium]